MSRGNMYKMEKSQKMTSQEGLQSKKILLSMIMLMLFFAILPLVSAEVTNSTYVAGTGEAIVYLSLNGILVLFLIGCLVLFLALDNLLVKVFSIGLGYLLLTAISFVGWQMALDFLTSAFLISIFKIIFVVLMIGAFPLLIGGFAWYLIMLFKIKEIQNLMTHGMSESDASDRVGRGKHG
jgi:hypothetical protein